MENSFNIAPLIAYKNEHGSIKNIKNSEIYNYNGSDYKIGELMSMLRRSYRARSFTPEKLSNTTIRPLTDKEVKILDDLGISWEKSTRK